MKLDIQVIDMITKILKGIIINYENGYFIEVWEGSIGFESLVMSFENFGYGNLKKKLESLEVNNDILEIKKH